MAATASFTLSKSVLLGVLILQTSVLATLGHECNGMGDRYCSDRRPEAAMTRDCPEPCEERRCRNVGSSTRIQRNGANPRRPRWEDFAKTGLYQHVYVHEKYVCMSSCWKHPWDAICGDWEYVRGQRYCTELRCDHDPDNRVSGCHKDANGNRKLPWHEPTCEECARLFPLACKYSNNRSKKNDDDDDDDDDRR